jgi:Transposase IS4
MVDPRRVIGSIVIAKACHVMSLVECARRYGSNKSTKILEGVVAEVVVVRNAGNNRTTTNITADYSLTDCVKRATLNIRCVTAKRVEEAEEEEEATISEDLTAQNNAVGDNAVLASRAVALTELEVIPRTPPALARQSDASTSTESPSNSTYTLFPIETVANIHATTTTPRSAAATNITHTAHGQNWYTDDVATRTNINGLFPFRAWGIRTPIGDVLGVGSNVGERMSRLDIFMLMFPPQQLETMLFASNLLLTENNKKPTTKGELLKYFGIIVLSTKFEFTSRASLWSNSPPTKYEKSPSFGNTGMSRARFDDLWRFIRWSDQPSVRQEGMSSEKYRWLLVEDFVQNFNNHRASNFNPSDLICVDESMSRWYGQGGDWINHGLPMYVAIDRKPENGCEIQNSACGRSGIMLRLKIVKTAREERANADNDNSDGLLHGTIVLKELIDPWFFSERLVCADSYFASVGAAEELRKFGMRFIGVVKTATRRYPMAYLSGIELQQRGDRKGLIAKDNEGKPNLLAFVWMDRARRYFIASGSSLAEGMPYIRDRWRQVSNEINADPTRVQLTVPQPKAAELYYMVCSKIDQHNRDRQDTLMIERKLQTHDWSTRVNLSLLSIILVDTWRAYSQLTFPVNGYGELQKSESQKEFYGNLAAELIDNSFDNIGM